jgi:molecular chaperone DnaK (HSP70)
VDPDLAVAKGAALRAHQLVGSDHLGKTGGTTGLIAGRQTGVVTPVTPRAIGFLIEDSFDPNGTRTFIDHVVAANTALPVDCRVDRFGTILPNQNTVRIQVFEQAGPIASPEVEHNRRVLDGELSELGELPANAVIELTVGIAVDGRLKVVAREPLSGRELTLEAFVEGVIDSAQTQQLTQAVGMIAVRG